jgi:hypothetical protein
MRLFLWLLLLLAATSAASAQDAGKKISIDAKDGRSYTDEKGRTIVDLTAATIKLFRSDKKDGKVVGTTLVADRATTESQPGGGEVVKLTLRGNVRAEEPDGTLTTADEAVIDLVKGIYTYTGKSIRIVTPEK